MTKKQEKFCQEYIVDFNGKGAAIRAGYSKKTAMEQASRMLRIVKVQEQIKKLSEKVSDIAGIQVNEILTELKIIAFSDITDYLNVNNDKITFKSLAEITPDKRRAIQSLHQTKDGIWLKLLNKQPALEQLGKYKGMFTEKLEAHFSGNIRSVVELVKHASKIKN